MANKRKGRPAKKHPKSTHLVVRVTPAKKQRYEDAADSAGEQLAEWVRRVLDSAALEELSREA